MIIELLANLKLKNGRILNAGVYDDSKITLPEEIYREVEIMKNGERSPSVVRVVKEDAPKPTAPKENEEINTLSQESDAVQTNTTKTSSSKSKPSSTSYSKRRTSRRKKTEDEDNSEKK